MRPADIHDDGGAGLAQLGQALADEAMHANPLQSDGVQHARRRLDDARRRMAFALGKEESLDGHRAEVGEVDGLAVFHAVPEAAAGGNQRILQRELTDGDGEIEVHTHAHTSALASKTGPPIHDRT